MEPIKLAIQRAKQAQQRIGTQTPLPPPISQLAVQSEPADEKRIGGTVVATDSRHLHEMRIIGHDGSMRHTSAYDMLRTHVLQGLKELSYKTIAITSPSPGCGKTVTAINLALSTARQVDQRVLLVDLDLRKPQISRYLGFRAQRDLADVLAGTCSIKDALVVPNLGAQRLAVLPLSNAVSHAAEQLASPPMKELVAALKKDQAFSTVIFDLPPMLYSDDFLAFVPQVDCALLIAEVGRTSARELRECERLIDEHKFFGCVLNKAQDRGKQEYYYATGAGK